LRHYLRAGHKTIQFLDVGDNPISEGGVEALVALCQATPTLKEVLFDGGTHYIMFDTSFTSTLNNKP